MGLALMLAGAECLVRAAAGVAARFNLRPLMLGLTMVALGSSAPQMAIALRASAEGAGDVALGSVFGGVIFSVLGTLGLCAVITPLRVSRQVVLNDLPLMFAATALVYALCLNQRLGRAEGAVLLVGLGGYIWMLLGQSRRHGHSWAAQGKPRSLLGPAVLAALGLGGTLLGSRWLIGATLDMATDLGLSERIAGLTAVAICAGLPQMLMSLAAVLRGERDLAVGNVIGSNLFNLLGVLGITALAAPLSVSPNALYFDLPVMLGVTLLAMPLFYAGYRITRLEGLLLLGLYAAYGLHLLAFTFGMPLAGRLEHTLLRALPLLGLVVAVQAWRTWRRRH
ncbi:calcium/sodium antiporter [Pseudomonas typographi]|uniref:calcium/sodium antiporter n=1 Tax=Pseudomonas typographi TaxID=2715964 RepID=UPI0016880E31|nr:calcium/sodium antiporter [Pseudomonas typographi]